MRQQKSKQGKKNSPSSLPFFSFITQTTSAPPPRASSTSSQSTQSLCPSGTPALACHFSTSLRSLRTSGPAQSLRTELQTPRARAAQPSAAADSWRSAAVGATATTIRALAVPPRQSAISIVSLELR